MAKMKLASTLLLIMLVMFSCKKKEKENPEPESPFNTTDQIFNFASSDGRDNFKVQFHPNQSLDLLWVQDSLYLHMNQTTSGSGARYQDETGYIFWNHGDDFTFSREDEEIASGSLVENR